MSNLNGVTINKGKIGANTLAGDDGVSGIVIVSHHKPDNMDYKKVYTFYNPVDAELAGITAEFDSANNINVCRHLKEFYRLSGEGRKLFVMLLADTETLSDVYNVHLRQMVIEAGGEIKQVAIATNLNLAVDAEPVYLDGIPKNVHDAIPLAQGFAESAYLMHMPFQILIECYDYKGPGASAANLRDLTVDAPKVSLVNGQDWSHGESLSGWSQKYADVGTALGTLSLARINQNMGENESFNLTDATRNAWMIPGLSSHQKNTEVYSDLQTLEDKGYIFGVVYPGLAGVRWNNDHVCVEIIVDAEGNINAHTIAYGRTEDKAVVLLRSAYLPKVKTVHPVDEKTGLLPPGVIKHFEGIGNTVFSDMVRRREISGGSVTVDPSSDLIIKKILKVKYRIVPYGSIGEIVGTMNLKTNL